MGERRELDELELGRTIQLLYNAFSSVLAVSGSLSPYVPTLESYIKPVLDLVEAFASRRREAGGPLVYYEPGCGAGHVAVEAVRRGFYTLCLELDEGLAREAARRLRGHPLADVVVGDLSSFTPRRADVVYAYLLPRAVALVVGMLAGRGAVIVSLDYPADSELESVLRAARLLLGYRSVYIYAT